MKDGFVSVAVGTPELQVASPLYNSEKIIALIQEAELAGHCLIVFPELSITGYSCGDLFLQSTLLRAAQDGLQNILDATVDSEMLVVVGLPVEWKNSIYNCAVVCQNGELLGVVPKTALPNYGEFYEKRHFAPAPADNDLVSLCGQLVPFGAKLVFACEDLPEFVLGVEICEDLWSTMPPSHQLAAAGATVLCNLSASNELVGKAAYRRELVKGQSAHLLCGYLFAAAGMGESTSDLVFSGHDLIAENGIILKEQRFTYGLCATELDVFAMSHERRRMQSYEGKVPEGYETIFFHWTLSETKLTRKVSEKPFISENLDVRRENAEEVLNIAAMGLARRISHTRAKTAVIGLSGGLDSTLALLLTARAFDLLGKKRDEILAVTMPCFGTTSRTKNNAVELAEHIGAELRTVSIGESVKQHFVDIGQSMECHDVTFENAQARERTQVLMDLANMYGGLVVGTGDLSELALGWATYNGDHMSMYGVNGSIPKTLVRCLVAHVAEGTEDAGLRQVLLDILDTPVSPELLPAVNGEIAQKTEDLVGPYELHDFFLYYFIRWAFAPSKIFRLACYAFGDKFDRETILKWLKTFVRRFFQQQFKRNCLPDGPKVGSVALSPRGDWRMPSDAQAAIWLQDLEQL